MSLDVEHLFGFGKVQALGSRFSLKLPFYYCASAHEIAFELILRNGYSFELPLVDDRNKICFAIVKF